MNTTMSFRMEKLRSDNFIKNYNHSNRKTDNINNQFLGKNIDKSKIKDNVFLVDKQIIDNCKSIDEVWEIFKNDYVENGTDFIEKKVKGEIKKVRKQFLKKQTNVKINVNGKNETQMVETSLISEFVFQLGGLENDLRGVLSKKDFEYLYSKVIKKIYSHTKGTILKGVIHFDESYPHLHLFYTPYNLTKHRVDNEWNRTQNNLSILQTDLHKYLKEILKEEYNIDLKKLEKSDKKNLSVKEFKELKHKTVISQIKKDTELIINSSTEGLFVKSLNKEKVENYIDKLLKKYSKYSIQLKELLEVKNKNKLLEERLKKRLAELEKLFSKNRNFQDKITSLSLKIENLNNDLKLTNSENIELKSDIKKLENDFKFDYKNWKSQRISKYKQMIQSKTPSL